MQTERNGFQRKIKKNLTHAMQIIELKVEGACSLVVALQMGMKQWNKIDVLAARRSALPEPEMC